MSKDLKTKVNVSTGMATALPEFKGYTVDIRLRQFRKVTMGACPAIDFIDFNSKEGDKLLQEYEANLQKDCKHEETEHYSGLLGYEATVCKKCGKHISHS